MSTTCARGSGGRGGPAPRWGRAVGGGSPFSYAVLRVVPRVERGERLNAGVVVFCRPLRYLAARTSLDGRRLAALGPDVDPVAVRSHLTAIERVAAGDPEAGPIAALD